MMHKLRFIYTFDKYIDIKVGRQTRKGRLDSRRKKNNNVKM